MSNYIIFFAIISLKQKIFFVTILSFLYILVIISQIFLYLCNWFSYFTKKIQLNLRVFIEIFNHFNSLNNQIHFIIKWVYILWNWIKKLGEMILNRLKKVVPMQWKSSRYSVTQYPSLELSVTLLVERFIAEYML